MSEENMDRIVIPVTNALAVYMRYSPLPRKGDFNPESWRQVPLSPNGGDGCSWELDDISSLGIEDGDYEYEFVIHRQGRTPAVAADPYAEEIVRFGGYRGVMHLRNSHRQSTDFDWSGEINPDKPLAQNHQLVIYELPMRWVETAPDAVDRQVGLGTFDKALFELLGHANGSSYMGDLGINAIELLPVFDSPDTVNWGYGSRFFFAPDFDMGNPVDLKLFIKECHRRGIRVILDIVMNHSRGCPLELMAPNMFYLDNPNEEMVGSEPRNSYGGSLFRYDKEAYGGFYAREFHKDVAKFWIENYHIDGFRIDEFKGIDNWDFIHDFHTSARDTYTSLFPDRPAFFVIAEDSWRRPQIANEAENERVVDAIWDFDFRDELRRLTSNTIHTIFGKPSRADRARALIQGNFLWDDWHKDWRKSDGKTVGFSGYEISQRIIYNTSHDIEKQEEQRLLPYFLERTPLPLAEWEKVENPSNVLDEAHLTVVLALEQVHSTFALMLTAVGVPMFLAGEEFGDLHDTHHHDWRQKMSDPLNRGRAQLEGHKQLLARVRQLIHLRGTHPALHRGEVDYFGMLGGFHPEFDRNEGCRVFAYCRTAGLPVGTPGQVAVVANCGPQHFPSFLLNWPWDEAITPEEYGKLEGQAAISIKGQAELELRPFQVRVFAL